MQHLYVKTSQRFIALTLLTIALDCGGCGHPSASQPQIVVDGSRDVRVLVRFDLDRIANQIERGEKAASDTKFGAILGWRARVGLRAATLMLIQDEASNLELLATIPDPSKSIWNALSGTNRPYLELRHNDDGTLTPNLDAWEEMDGLQDSLQQLTMKWHAGQILVASPQRLEKFEAGTWNVQDALASKLIERVETTDSLITLAALVPEELNFDLKAAPQGLLAGKAAENIPRTGRMILAMATSWFEGLREQLKTTDAVAVDVSLAGGQRHVRYAQLFRANDTAESVYGDLTSTNTDGNEAAADVAEFLHDEQVNERVSRSGRLVEIEAAWAASADRHVASSAKLVAQSVLASVMEPSVEPTEGPIQTRYVSPPNLVNLPAKEMKAAVTQYLGSQIFPGWVYDQGDAPSMQLELDTLALPNGQLIEGSYEVVSVMTTQGKEVLRDEEESAQNQSLQLSHPGTSFLKIPLRPDVDKTQLKTARIRFFLDIPSHVDVVEFSAQDEAGTKKKLGKQWVKVKQIARDVAEVTYRSRGAARLFAFDETDRPLASRESMRGGGSAASRFSGLIDKLWVAIPFQVEHCLVDVAVDLNGGESLRLPDNPSDRVPVRYDATPLENYVSIKEQELRNLSVVVQTAPGFANRECLRIDLPRLGSGIEADWELYWFAKDRPITLAGFSYSQNGQLSWSSQEGLRDATAVAGWAKVTVPTDFVSLEFRKRQTGSWQTKRVASQTVEFRIARNSFTYKTGDLTVMSVAALDAAGRRLKTEYASQADGATTQRVWGQPERVELVVSERTIEKVIDVDIAREGTDESAFAAFKQQIPQYHRAFAALTQIQRAIGKGPYGYDELAGLHYLHGRQHQPLRLIPIELAHACPQGAERFGFAPRPFSGYYFARLPQEDQNNSHSGEVRTYRWDKGEFEVQPNNNQFLVAIPKDENCPTFVVRWGSTYMKFLGGKRLSVVPSQLSAEGWSELSFVQTPNASDNLASAR